MNRRTTPIRPKVALGALLLLVALSALAAACVDDDLYAPCELPTNSEDAAIAECAKDGEKSCVVANQIQCETRNCARFQGSDLYCTRQCAADGDCPGGVCLELVLQSGVKYCVKDSFLTE